MLDQLLPQPPPDAPAPPRGEAALRSTRKMGWLIGIGVGSAILLIFLTAPMTIRARKSNPATDAINNARQVGLALTEFESKFGKFPDSSTVAVIRRTTGSTLAFSDRTSNDLFSQLFAALMDQSEAPFYAKAMSARKPDGIFSSDATLLEHGECGFAYISGLDSTCHPDTPLIFGPVIPGTTTLDQKSFNGKAVVLRLDNSATTYPINSSGKIISNGLDLLDPRQPFWHGKAPNVKWPK